MIDFGLAKPYINYDKLKDNKWSEEDHIDMQYCKPYGNRAF